MSFNDFPVSQELIQGIFCMGFNTPTEFQKEASKNLLSDQRANMIAQAHMGSGKTVASVLAMLDRVDVTRHYPQVVCLSPTPYLALDRGEVAESMGQFIRNLEIGYAVGGIRAVPRGEKVTDHIIFGTPGTLLDWIRKHKVLDPKKIELCVLDQADVMIALQGHQDQSIRIQKTLRKDCQMLFITETYNDMVKEFAKSVVPNVMGTVPYHVEEWLGNIKHYYVKCQSREEKLQALSNIYGVVPIGQCVVFCQTTSAASWLSQKMSQDGHSVTLIVDEMTEDERFRALRKLFSGSVRLLITTVDFDLETLEVTTVINYDMPMNPIGEPDCETYRRRAHHTGWLNREGIVLNFTDIQPSMETMRKMGQTLGINMTHLDTDDVDTLNNLQGVKLHLIQAPMECD